MELVAREPHFKLAHALLADVRRVRAGLGSQLTAQPSDPALQALADEWQRRLRAPDHLPSEAAWPAGLVTFSPQSRHAFVVDASTLRLYWFQRPEDDGPPKLVSSFYISVGKAGVGKQVEGDNKTPLGVYRITGRRPAEELPAFYGAGALVLDYPNPVDRLLGRTGSGIWLHGSPPDTYTRDPLASEGCIVLANPDMRQLIELRDAIDSPVLVVPSVQWLPPGQHQRERDEALALIQMWARQRLGQDLDLTRLGVQRWIERDGQRYWRVEYRPDAPDGARHTWFLREAEDGLQHVAGALPARPAETVQAAAPAARHREEGAEEASANPNAEMRPVLQAVQSWARAWSARDVKAYLAHYHPRFQPEAGLSRAAWEAQRRQRIEDKRRIEVEVLQPRVRLDGQRASVTFIQRYRADGQRELRVRKTLVLQREGSRWLIVEERTR
ncbi:L,D-transpeptidase catalytic domain [Tepidimonas alkaliphilus]|uniref:L,D-transpeptidase catalytic domain n=2 Tax=Tepidimonas alkaliphilus TaxID=2588942 RepID=A0A554WAC7_9BURK|nr:L,D-transpeptidase catalytic domain [Tepidimonas alkaliphilus]